MARETKKDNQAKRSYGGRRYAPIHFIPIKFHSTFVLDREVLAHAIIVILLNHEIIEAAAVVVVLVVTDRVVPQVAIVIIVNNGMHPMVAAVGLYGLVIIRLVAVAMIVIHSKQVLGMEIVSRIIAGGIAHRKIETPIEQ